MNLVSHLLLSIARKHAHRLRRNLSPQHRRGKKLYRLVDSPVVANANPNPSPSSSRAAASSSSASPGGGDPARSVGVEDDETEHGPERRERERLRLRLAEAKAEAERERRAEEREWIRRVVRRAARHPRAARWQQPCRWPCVRDGETALHAACRRRCGCPPEIVRALLAAHPPAAALRSRGGEGYTPLHALCAASHHNNSSGARTSPPPPSPPPPSAAANGNDNGAAASGHQSRNDDDRDGRRRLSRQAEERQLLSMKILLETKHGREALSSRDAFGRTPLHLLCLRNGPPDMVRLLLATAAAASSASDDDDDASSPSPSTPSTPSASNFLAGGGSSSNLRPTSSTRRPRQRHQSPSSPSSSSLPVIQDAMGNTPLHYAASRGCPEETVRLLLSADDDCLVDHNSNPAAPPAPAAAVASGAGGTAAGVVRAKRAATMKNRSGCLPLHYGCYCAPAQPGVLRLLVWANPSAVCTPSGLNRRISSPSPPADNADVDRFGDHYDDGDPDDVGDDEDDEGDGGDDDDEDDFESVSSPVEIETAVWGAAAGAGATPLAMLWRRYAFGAEDRALLSSVRRVGQMRGGVGHERGEKATAARTRGGPLESLWEDAAAMLRASRVVRRRRGGGCDGDSREVDDGDSETWCWEGGAGDDGVVTEALDADVMRILHAVAATRYGGGGGRRHRRGRSRNNRDDNRHRICPRGMVDLIDRLFDTLVRDAVAASSGGASTDGDEGGTSDEGRARSDEIGGDRGICIGGASSAVGNNIRGDDRDRRRRCPPSLRDLFVGAIEVGMRWEEGLDELWRADPEVLSRPLRHGRYGVVYPFALAGCVGRHPREPSADVDTIYQLVRRRPDVIQMGIVL